MAKLFLMDFETTHIDPKQARPIEYYGRLWDTENDSVAEGGDLLYDADYPTLTDEISKLTGIDIQDLLTDGKPPRPAMEMLIAMAGVADWFVAHNGRSYDKIVLESECVRHGLAVPKIKWLDTRFDLPFPERLRCRVLSHVALEHGYPINPENLHRAKADVDLMHLILRKYDMASVLKNAAAPVLYVKAGVKFDTREKAKARGFRWQQFDDASPSYPTTWVKKIRDYQLEEERQLADFEITVLEKQDA